MFRKTSIAVFIALFIVLAVSGLYYDQSVYRYADGKPKEEYIDNFVNDSVLAGENFIGGMSGAMTTISDIFGIVRKIPIVKELVIVEEEKDWTKVEIYELDYRKAINRNKTDLDVLPPKEFVKYGDELIVKTYCADYDVYHPHRAFYRVWIFTTDGINDYYYTDRRCYASATYQREIIQIIGKKIRKVNRGKYLGSYPLGYVNYEDVEWWYG